MRPPLWTAQDGNDRKSGKRKMVKDSRRGRSLDSCWRKLLPFGLSLDNLSGCFVLISSSLTAKRAEGRCFVACTNGARKITDEEIRGFVMMREEMAGEEI